MADIVPFRGILYNQEKIDDYRNVVTPPYDVISPDDQKKYYDRHPANVIRLDLSKKNKSDTPEDNHNTRAAYHFNQWLKEGILVRDDKPAFYFTSTEFKVQGKSVVRYGMIAMVGLEPFEKGIILPHEKTFSKVKSERLELMKQCHANFSQIFSIYRDNKGILSILKAAVDGMEPLADIVDDKGDRHKLWRITDTSVNQQVSDTMKEKKLFIADGHHRYETALNYRNWISKNDPDFDASHPANYIMMYLCSMDDPGLVILPAHRMQIDVGKENLSGFRKKAQAYFDITPIPFSDKEKEKTESSFADLLKKNEANNAFGVFMKGCNEFLILVLKNGVMDKLFGNEIPNQLKTLDVTVLTRLIFMEILGFSQKRLDNEKLIAYSSNAQEALSSVESGRCDMAFIMNPAKMNNVREIASAGLIMPRKTTYFYPKAITGLVMNDLRPQSSKS
ncbi:MAG: DUF1015 domain-containing protein [Deltaproteobacteria bacterium]|nr:DUF1015 domain-containing protein [Deltaproteobacteria bacterium]